LPGAALASLPLEPRNMTFNLSVDLYDNQADDKQSFADIWRQQTQLRTKFLTFQL